MVQGLTDNRRAFNTFEFKMSSFECHEMTSKLCQPITQCHIHCRRYSSQWRRNASVRCFYVEFWINPYIFQLYGNDNHIELQLPHFLSRKFVWKALYDNDLLRILNNTHHYRDDVIKPINTKQRVYNSNIGNKEQQKFSEEENSVQRIEIILIRVFRFWSWFSSFCFVRALCTIYTGFILQKTCTWKIRRNIYSYRHFRLLNSAY